MMRPFPSAAGGLLSYFTRHRTLANLLLVAILLAGAFALPNMRTQFFPDVALRNINVTASWDGASAEDIDRGFIEAISPALLAVDGVDSSSSTAREGFGSLRITFVPDWDMARAREDVQVALDALTDLPEDIEDLTVDRAVWRDRVTDVVIYGPVDPAQIGRMADELNNRLFRVGVAQTTLRGVVAPRTLVEVPSRHLIAYDITMAEIAAAIEAEVEADPAGDVAGANARIRTGVEKREADALETIVLRNFADGSKLTIGDIATISQLGTNRERSYFVSDDPAVSIRVDRTADGDAIGIQETVQEVADEMQATLPQGVSVELIRTRAEAISSRLDILISNGIMGLGLVLCLLFLFLNARTALWVAAGIPAAMMAAIAIMYVGGLTLNMISLFGLIITLGIVVDDAIVVGEHADYRARHLGEPPINAAENAARRMAMPVFAATLTTVIAFFGLVAIGGRFGSLIEDIPLTVIAVLAASLVECFLILPNHMAHALAARAKQRWYDWPSRQVNRGFTYLRENAFRPMMAGVISARYAVLAGVVVILASQVAVFIRGDVQWRFFNAPERGTITGNFAMLDTATRADSLEMMQAFQRVVEEVGDEYKERYGVHPVTFAIAEIGGNAGRGLSGVDNKDRDLLGGISVDLIDAEERPYSAFAFVADLQDRLERHPLTETAGFRGTRSGPGGDALNVRFSGAEPDTLKAASLALQEELLAFPEVSGVEDNLTFDKEELILDLTAQGQALGFSIDELGRSLRNRLGGIEAATYPDGPRSAEIRVELPEGELTADFLERTQMRTPEGIYVPLADIVSVDRRLGFGSVRRENGVRVVSVTGDISEDNPERASLIESTLQEEILPLIAASYQVDWEMAGLAEDESTFLQDALNGLILCLAGIYLVLAWIFASWTRPLVVMAIIPFGLVGTIYGHHAWDVPLSMFTVVGLLGMTGIIINDSIVLVTTIDEHARDRGLIPSIIDGAADRLRPVLLTTLTTVLGMMPLLFETSRQAQFLKPTVITLVYGLGFGMVLVLLVVPALIAVQHDLARHVTALQRGLRAPLPAMRFGMMALSVLVLGWGAATMGWTFWTGALPEPIAQWGMPGGPMQSALILFVAGAGAICAVGYAALSLLLARRLGRP